MNTYMKYALELAAKGKYFARPNPLVGCVIVHNDGVVASGYHAKSGEPHAEINALKQLDFNAQGMDIYVTLEPCSHYGKTPPCLDAVINARPKRVIIASVDPNPEVDSITKMQEAGIEVITGVCEDQAQKLNLGFFKRMRTGLPYVRLKLATSIDGKIAMKNGESKWITGETSRMDVQQLRASSDALISSSNTVIADNPRFNVRDTTLPSPLKVIMDRRGRITKDDKKLHIFQGMQTILTGDTPQEVLTMLGRRAINEVLIEAGGVLAGAFIEQHLVDELIVYQAAKILGSSAKPMIDSNILSLIDAPILTLQNATPMGEDLKLTYTFNYVLS